MTYNKEYVKIFFSPFYILHIECGWKHEIKKNEYLFTDGYLREPYAMIRCEKACMS
jgi:hypothetical protein